MNTRPLRSRVRAAAILLPALMMAMTVSLDARARKGHVSTPAGKGPASKNAPQSYQGGPKIWLQDSQTLGVTHVGADGTAQNKGAAQILAAGQGQPLSMTHGDFDQDGVEDLAVGYATPGGGAIVVHRGNLDAFAPQSDASFQAIGRGEFPAPFLPQAKVFSIPIRPDFLAAGNFTGNGNTDLVAASQGGNALYVFPGDGKGNFGQPQIFSLSGAVHALAAGNLGNGQSFTNLIVGISNSQKSFSLLVLGGTGVGLGALASFPLGGPASNIAFGDFGAGADAAFLSGGQVFILRSSSLQLVKVSLPVSASAFALGSFIYDRNGGSQIALLAPNGSIQIAARNEFDPRVYTVAEFNAIRRAKLNHQPPPSFFPVRSFPANGWKIVESFPSVGTVSPGQTPVFFRTRVSTHGADDVMWLNASAGQLAVISHPDLKPGAPTFLPGQISFRPYSGSPVTALPLRVNVDGRPGVMALHQGAIAPAMVMPIPDPTFFVNTDNDPTPTSPIANACNNTTFTDVSSSCSLREAILKANGDTIMLQAGHNYSLTIGRGATQDYTGNTGALYVNQTATIVGGNQNTTVIQWGTPSPGGTTVDMVMAVNEDLTGGTDATASISNLTIQNGVNNGASGVDGDGGCMEFDTGINGTATLTLTSVTLQNCSTLQGGGGGIVLFNIVAPGGGGSATISNSIIQNNSAADSTSTGPGGGIAISADASMVMSNSQVLNNKASGIGGGIVIFTPQNISATAALTSITASTISGNNAAGFGGGIWNASNLTIDQGTIISGNSAGVGPVAGQEGGGLYLNTPVAGGCPGPSTCTSTLTKVTITGNTATGNGGGISNGSGSASGSMTMSFSRLAGNSTSGLGSNLNNNHATATVTNNWWGTNNAASTINTSVPDVNGSATTTFDPFIVLTHTASPQKIRINQSTMLTGDMSLDNQGNGAALSGNLDEIVGLPITFDSPVLGTIPQTQPETLGNPVPTATATFTAGATSGLGSANATVDQAVVPVNSNLIASATEASTTATITTVGAHGFSTGEFVTISGVGVSGYNGSFFTITSTPTATTFTYTANSSGLGASSGGTANAGIVILQPPSITKSFNPTTVAINATSTITFSITNGNVVPINASFTDTLPANLVVANTPNVVNNCGGSVTAGAGATSISFSNPSSLAAGTCTIKVDVQSAVDNTYANSVTIDSTDAGNGNTSSANLTVVNPPTITKAFGAASIPKSGTTSLTFTIQNPNTNSTLSGVAFTDNLPAGLLVANPPNVTGSCGSGTITATAGSGVISLSGGTLTASPAAGSSCTFSADVVGASAGVQNNSVQVTSTEGGTGNTSNASITVVFPPSISKAFGAASIPLNGTTSLTFTLASVNASTTLTGIAFSDTLPAGLIISTPNGLTNSCGGTVTATQATNVISLSGGTLAPSNSCTIVVNVTGIAAGDQNNTTGNVSSTEGGTGGAFSASTTVVAPPSIAKAFNPTTIAVNATTSLQFTITNPAANTVALTGVAFTDTLPTGLTVANGTSTVCGGTLTTTNPTGIALSGASINTNSQCQFSVTVTGAASGNYTNTTGAVSSTNGGTGNTATANLTVANPPTITKVFGASQIPLNGTTSLTFNIANPNTNAALSGVAFTDSLPAGLVVAATPNVTGSCGSGTITAVGGSSTISLSGGTLTASPAAGSSCTFSVNVTGTTAGVKNNSVQVTSTEGGTGNTSNASITVVAPPGLTKGFGAASIALNGSTSLSFTVNNPNAAVALTGIGFSDTLPAGLIVMVDSAGPCGSGTFTATGGTSVISLSGGTLAASGSCNFSLNVTGITGGTKNNTTGNVTSTEGGTGGTASASIDVVAPPTIAKGFTPGGIAPNGVSTLTITITNPAGNAVQENGVAFTDNLPANLVVATPNGLNNTCGGTATATAGGTSVALTGGTIAANSSCTVTANVTSAFTGMYLNSTGAVSSTNGGTGGAASATLFVAFPPTISKLFLPNTVQQNGTTLLSFTITNPNSNSTPPNADVTLTGITFTDSLPAGLVVAASPNVSNDCGGTVTAVPGSSSISLAGGNLNPAVGLISRLRGPSRVQFQAQPIANGACFISVTVKAVNSGTLNNTTGQISANESGPGATSNTASLTVTAAPPVVPPTIAKVFGASSIPLNGTTSLTFTFNNPNSGTPLVNISVSDNLPSGLVVANPNGLTGTCVTMGVDVVANPGSGTISVTSLNLPGSGSCSFSVNVTGTTAGTKNNTSGNVTATFDDGSGTFVPITGGTASASIVVVGPPSISKAFNPVTMAQNDTSTLSFTIINPAGNTVAETGVAFTDTLPANVVVATPNGLTGSCGGGTITATAGSGTVSLSGATLAPGAQCTFSVNVTSSVIGAYNNSTTVTSANGGNGNTASATLTVGPPLSISPITGAEVVPAGTTATYLLTVTSLSPSLGNILFNCSNLPFGAACTFNPMTENQVGAVQVTLTITTTGNLASVFPGSMGKTAPVYAALLFPFIGLVGIFAGGRKSAKAKLRMGLFFVALLGVLAFAGCQGATGKPQGTPRGSFPVSVTATSSAKPSVQASTTVILTVQ